MSFLDNLESNLKSMESREERGGQNSREPSSAIPRPGISIA